MPRRRSIPALLLVAVASLAAAHTAPAAPAPLQYDGVSPTTTRADLQARYPGQMTWEWDAQAPGSRTGSGGIFPLQNRRLDRASSLIYWEKENAERVIRLFFGWRDPKNPNREINVSCRILLDPLRRRFGREQSVERYDEEAFRHEERIWKRGDQSMILDCGNLPKRRTIVDRLEFQCRGSCMTASHE